MITGNAIDSAKIQIQGLFSIYNETKPIRFNSIKIKRIDSHAVIKVDYLVMR